MRSAPMIATSTSPRKDLGGWVPVGTPDAFKVEKGAILSTGASPYPSWLRTEMPYENFILRLEYQTLGWYEGGILIHAPVDGPASKLGLQGHLRHDRLDYQADRKSTSLNSSHLSIS